MVKIEDIAEMNIVVNLSLWSALKLRIAGITNYIANEKDEKAMGEIDEMVVEIRELARKSEQADKKDVMCITKMDFKKAYGGTQAYWLVTLHVTNPNCMLVYAKNKIVDTIRSTYMYPNYNVGVIFIVHDDKAEYDTGVDEIVNSTGHSLVGSDLLIARMIREKHEGKCYECEDVKEGELRGRNIL